MHILTIAWNEIKRNLRSPIIFAIMIAFPIILILILGTALTNVFSTNITVGDMNVLYRNMNTSESFASSWQSFTEHAENTGIHLVQASDDQNGTEEVMNNRYSGYVEIDDSGIHYFGSSKDSIESSIIQGTLTAFTNQYKLAIEVAKAAPDQLEEILTNTGDGDDYILETSLNGDRKPGALDYYAVSMTTMFAFLGGFFASSLIQSERTRKTAIRLLASPVSRGEILTGKIMGSVVINAICVAAAVLFSMFVFNAYWGHQLGMVAIILLSEVILAVALGVGISYLIKGEGAAMVMMIFVQVASFLGGAYFPLDDLTGVFGFIARLSPLQWANSGLTQFIYADDLPAAMSAIGLNTGVAALFIVIIVIALRRREGL